MIDDIFNEMVSRNLVKSKGDFSTNWLGKAGNYFGHYSRDHFSSDALIHLIKRLNAAGQVDLSAKVMALLFETTPEHRHREPA